MTPLVLLSVMMFLQYSVWGAWFPVASKYLQDGLQFSIPQTSLILGTAASIGAVTAPFAGQIADRYCRAEWVLGALLVAGGFLQLALASQTEYAAWFALSIGYSVVYMPTLALSNSVAFAHMTDRARQFPLVRVWGTIGWIAAGWAFPLIWLPLTTAPETAETTLALGESLRFSAVLSFGYAAFCLLLPRTPPKRDAAEKLAIARALGLLRRRSFATLVVATLVISIIHYIYFFQAGPYLTHLGLADTEIGPAMSIGQISEIVVMALLAFLLKSVGFRNILALGALAYFVRYTIWALEGVFPVPVLVGSQVLHGVCYACFYATAFIYVDRIAPDDVRHSAQTLFGILIFGGGPILGGLVNGYLGEAHALAEGGVDFSGVWFTVAAIGLAMTAFLGFLFRDETGTVDSPVTPGESS